MKPVVNSSRAVRAQASSKAIPARLREAADGLEAYLAVMLEDDAKRKKTAKKSEWAIGGPPWNPEHFVEFRRSGAPTDSPAIAYLGLRDVVAICRAAAFINELVGPDAVLRGNPWGTAHNKGAASAK